MCGFAQQDCLRHFFDSSGDLVSKNAISSRKDVLHIACLCGVFVEMENGYSHQSSQSISAQRRKVTSGEGDVGILGKVTSTLCCLELSYVLSTDLHPGQGALSLYWLDAV